MARLQTLKPAVRMLNSAVAPQQLERGNSTQRGYTYKWQQYRERWLQAHPLCGDRENEPSAEHSQCRRENRTTAATDVDHIKRITGPSDPLFWDQSNHQSLCHPCHSIKTQNEVAGEGRTFK